MSGVKEKCVSIKELEIDLLNSTGNPSLAKQQAQAFAIHYAGRVIDAVKFRKGNISKDDLLLSRHIRWEHHKRHSQNLAKNMLSANRGPKPSNTCAHHIVPWFDDKSAACSRSRLRLAAWGIDIDHEANGVWLPRFRCHIPHDGIPTRVAHSQTHTMVYYLNVDSLLRDTIAEGLGRTGIIDTLREVGEMLHDGDFPVNRLI